PTTSASAACARSGAGRARWGSACEAQPDWGFGGEVPKGRKAPKGRAPDSLRRPQPDWGFGGEVPKGRKAPKGRAPDSLRRPQPEHARAARDGSESLKPIVLYNPRAESHILPLGLVHVGSMFPDRPVHVVDGRLEQAPAARVIELTRDAACLGVSVL